jgi:hypothetical protein
LIQGFEGVLQGRFILVAGAESSQCGEQVGEAAPFPGQELFFFGGEDLSNHVGTMAARDGSN